MILGLIVFLPLLMCIVAWMLEYEIKFIGVSILTTAGVGISMVLSMLLFIPGLQNFFGKIPDVMNIFVWLSLDHSNTYWSLKFDPLVKIMLFVVTTVSFVVHVYSIGYMHHDKSKSRFMLLISLFTFFMLLLVTSNDFIQLFCGWEGVGLCSYLLIGFWHHKDSANYAAQKAFIVNRVGDLGLIIAMAMIYFTFGTFEFSAVFLKIKTISNASFCCGISLFDFIALMLFVGAMGKSAQFGLHVWLPDAMEGPTPVSALIHAATMVTAGIFLMVRCSPFLEVAPFAKNIILIIGSITALFGATVAMAQTDIKRVIAFSTCSQLGFMFMSIGSGFYTGAIFHLFTHAFFKAALFLGAGSVIHAFSDEQNIKKMGHAFRYIPYTYFVMWIGSLALAGFPPFSGFFSKESIIHVLSHNTTQIGLFAYCVSLLVAFLTSFYIFRLLFLVFHGQERSDDKVVAHIHESSLSMLLPLLVIVVFAGAIGISTHHLFLGASDGFWKGSGVTFLKIPSFSYLDPLIIFPLGGLLLAWIIYVKGFALNRVIRKRLDGFYKFFLNKWFIDELYDVLFVKPMFFLGRIFWKIGDEKIIENMGPNFLSYAANKIGFQVKRLQTGYISDYVIIVLGFIVLMIPCVLLWRYFNG